MIKPMKDIWTGYWDKKEQVLLNAGPNDYDTASAESLAHNPERYQRVTKIALPGQWDDGSSMRIWVFVDVVAEGIYQIVRHPRAAPGVNLGFHCTAELNKGDLVTATMEPCGDKELAAEGFGHLIYLAKVSAI